MGLAAAIRVKNDEAMLRERRCIVSGETLSEDRLVRFVVSPDGEIVPDVGAVFPGRGIWVEANARAMAVAVKKNLFAKAAKAQVKVAPEIAARVEQQLVARMQADLGMARRAGHLLLGFDTVTAEIKSATPPALLIEAQDGAPDGRRKVFGAAHARGLKIETIECLTSRELGVAVGRENVIHAALKPGRLAERLIFDAGRLAGFRPASSAKTSAGSTPAPNERDA